MPQYWKVVSLGEGSFTIELDSPVPDGELLTRIEPVELVRGGVDYALTISDGVVTVKFTDPPPPGAVVTYLACVVQQAVEDWQYSTNLITFTVAPAAGKAVAASIVGAFFSSKGIQGPLAAWSNTVAIGTGLVSVYTVPCVSGMATLFIDNVELVLGTDYTITATAATSHTITLTNPLALNSVLKARWRGWPHVAMQVGDVFESAEGYAFRVKSITTASSLVTEEAIYAAATDLVHRRALVANAGNCDLEVPLGKLVRSPQLRIIVVPGTDAYGLRIIGITPRIIAAGSR